MKLRINLNNDQIVKQLERKSFGYSNKLTPN